MAARPIIALLVLGGVARANAPITGGTPSSESAVVALAFGDTLVCSGTLIAPQAVLTAGHCVGAAPLPDVAVGDALAGATHHVSLAALVYPAFDRATLDHDVAVVIVEPTLGVTPLPYGSTLEGAGSGSQIEVVGYGWTVANDPAPAARRTGTSVIDSIDALRIVSHAAPSQACEGDSGGPALFAGSVIGVASSGDASCTQYARHTRVDVHADFIADVLRRSAPGAAGPGERCWYDANCSAGACLPAQDDPRWSFCAPACDHGSCPDGLQCITIDGDARCRPAAPSPGAEGAACGSDTDCAGALCRAPAGGGAAVCTQTCFRDDPSLACPAAETCQAAADGTDACFAAAAGGCDGGGGDSGWLVALTLCAVAAGRRYRGA